METKSYILKREEFLSKGKLINKFMPLERALSLLETKAIWFANPETWPDPYEKYFLCAKYGSKEFQWRGRISAHALQTMRQVKRRGMHIRKTKYVLD